MNHLAEILGETDVARTTHDGTNAMAHLVNLGSEENYDGILQIHIVISPANVLRAF